MEEKKVPALRFRGFDNAWEQHKLGELSEKTYGGGTPSTANAEYWCGNIPWLQSSDIIDGKLFDVTPKKYISQVGLNSSAAQLIPENSIAIITRVGVGKLAFLSFFYTTSQDFLSMSRLTTEPYFTVYACYKKLQSELNSVQGTSIKGITKDELLAKEIKVPSYDEQKQIGEYFTNLDNLISLHQRKLEMLKKVKKSMLEKMFPKNDAKVPEVRFSDFTDAWEQCKVNSLFEPLTERNDDLLPYSKTLSVATMTYKEVGNGAADSSLANYKRLRLGDVAFEGHTSKEFRYGRFVLNDAGDGIMSPRFSALRPISELPVQFWKYYIHYEPIMKRSLVNCTKAGTMMNELVVPEFLQESLLVPSTDEQVQIGKYFANLNHLIILHQRKLEKLKNIKKSMLEKMFII